MEKSKVYFTRNINSEEVVRLYEKLGINLPGKVAIKVHSGEVGNQNFLHPIYFKPIVDYLNGRVVECNTAYEGERNTTEKHKKTFEKHGWNKYFSVDLMDEEDNDIVLDIPDGLVIKKDYVGNHLANYDSVLVVSHFKGHPMGGFGGALKQLSIGFASSHGKSYIHSGGTTTDQYKVWGMLAKQDDFLEAMADAASAVCKYFKNRIAFINVMVNLSVDCDCCAVAEDPCMKDIGILASTDPIAIDQACLDLIKKSQDRGRDHFLARVNRQHGDHIIEASINRDFGTNEYELIDVTDEK